VARRVREQALADLPDRDIATTHRVLDHICAILGAALEETSA
jgi:hypothetical protein